MGFVALPSLLPPQAAKRAKHGAAKINFAFKTFSDLLICANNKSHFEPKISEMQHIFTAMARAAEALSLAVLAHQLALSELFAEADFGYSKE